MNIHKKLLGLKFKTCQPHKMISDGWQQPYRMVLDDTNITSKYINGKWERIETKKEHPKWEKFYKLVFDESLTIWIKTNQTVLGNILELSNDFNNNNAFSSFIKPSPKNRIKSDVNLNTFVFMDIIV